GGRRVLRERGRVALGRGASRGGAEHALQQDLHRRRQARDVADLREREVAELRFGQHGALEFGHVSRSFTRSRSFSSSATVAATLSVAKRSSCTPRTISYPPSPL